MELREVRGTVDIRRLAGHFGAGTSGGGTAQGLGLTGLRERECRGLVERLRRLEVVPPARSYEAGKSYS